jgi:pimeloyl-ACP methyl ester carboxylesterase
MSVVTRRIGTDEFGEVSLTIDERGAGQPFLLLHGGAGPASMQPFAQLLGAERDTYVLTPTHPGFAITERPANLSDVRGLARVYARLLDELALDNVTVIGNSVGGWIAAELGLLKTRWVSGLVLVDAVGIDVPGHPVTDVSHMAPPQIMQLSFHDPSPFLRDPASLSDQDRAVMAANQVALGTYAPQMTDPTLAGRLGDVEIPVIVIWGESDGIVDIDSARAYDAAFQISKLVVLPGTGHMPQMETPELLLSAILNRGDETAPTSSIAAH